MTIDTNIKQDKAIGRYLYLTVDGIEYRVYYEESGEGIPLLLQHKAGCDGRQYRHVLKTMRSPRTTGSSHGTCRITGVRCLRCQ